MIAKYALAVMVTVAGTTAVVGREDAVYTETYSVAELPVWSHIHRVNEPSFNPSILIALIQATVRPDSWSDVAEIKADVTQMKLTISQTKQGHQEIAKLLEGFRPRIDPRFF